MAKKMVVAILILIAFSLLATSFKPLFRPIPDINAFLRIKDSESWAPPPPPPMLKPIPRQERDVDFSKGIHLIGKRPADWKVEISTLGMFGVDQLYYDIFPYELRVTKTKGSKGKEIILFDEFISETETAAIFEACLRTLERFRFQDEPSRIYDGTFMSISIYANSQILTARYVNLSCAEEAGVEVKAIMNKIEAHLNKGKVSK